LKNFKSYKCEDLVNKIKLSKGSQLEFIELENNWERDLNQSLGKK